MTGLLLSDALWTEADNFMHKQERITLYGIDCRDAMGLFMVENSVDSIVTDPPYGLGFMGKEWDHGVPGVEFWKHAFDVLKPGGHLLAFSGSRTYHRMVCSIEDAGFEIRDQIMWVYGSGFPKSMDVSKAIDKAAGAEREKILVPSKPGNVAIRGQGPIDMQSGFTDVSLPVTESAKQWQGWGTALKPAHEPICVARKPLISTVAANVLHWGTGALNIDACRVGEFVNTTPSGVDRRNAALADAGYRPGTYQMGETTPSGATGRWPANLIHDGSDEVLAAFPDAKGQQGDLTGHANTRGNGIYGDMAPAHDAIARIEIDKSAARFFYCAKASRKDRNEGLTDPGPQFAHGTTLRGVENTATTGNTHPTVKPTDLMRYLCRLVTPPGGVVLDPFMGSGSTGKAALREGFRFIGCELDASYLTIAAARLAAETGGAV